MVELILASKVSHSTIIRGIENAKKDIKTSGTSIFKEHHTPSPSVRDDEKVFFWLEIPINIALKKDS